MGMIRGKGFVDALKLMFDAASPKKMWTHKHNDGRLSIFALANSFAKALAGIPNSESLAIVCDIVLPAWDGEDTDKPMTLLNHASFYMKRQEDFYDCKKLKSESTAESVIKGNARELNTKLWAHFQNDLVREGFHDMVFGVNEHCWHKKSKIKNWYYRPTKIWDAYNEHDIFKSVTRMFDLMCDL